MLKMYKVILTIMICSFCLFGCGKPETKTVTTKNPDAEEIIRLDRHADILQWKDIIYQTNIDWVNELKLTKGKSVGEITALVSTVSNKSFKNGTANNLPVGAKIYTAKEREDILIVEFNGRVAYYLAVVEG
ncbi:hypothetical protein [Bacillus sp. AFS041924]|uniref:hypothetical protein n=1 Tax=Bacillus sp. AFS041924 TaxID=2033503 RepID=UPI000BFB624D|nr:hypothetical protein [Bacillus sp. AFS041924]PGS54155.1 hypothetical protein COC46_05430 [Bacillus sp. AFS041924]